MSKVMMIEGRWVPRVDDWEKRIEEFTETLNQLQKDKARLMQSIDRARSLGFFNEEFLRPIGNAVWRTNRSIQWYEKELRIDKSYINYDEKTKQAIGRLISQ